MDLLQVLGIPEHISIEDACSMEHQVSDVTMNTIREFVNFQGTIMVHKTYWMSLKIITQ